MKKLMSILSSNVEVKVDRDWCWISGDTKPIKEDLKELGFRWSPRRKQWYHRDAESLGVTSDIKASDKAIAKVSKKSTSKTKSSKATSKSSKATSNARSTYKYGAKRFINDFADKDELSEILDMIIARISE